MHNKLTFFFFFSVDFADVEVQRKTELAREMLDRYAGLPLAITVLGGLLSRKQTVEEWGEVHKNTREFISN